LEVKKIKEGSLERERFIVKVEQINNFSEELYSRKAMNYRSAMRQLL
jgi:hypothetical protein